MKVMAPSHTSWQSLTRLPQLILPLSEETSEQFALAPRFCQTVERGPHLCARAREREKDNREGVNKTYI